MKNKKVVRFEFGETIPGTAKFLYSEEVVVEKPRIGAMGKHFGASKTKTVLVYEVEIE